MFFCSCFYEVERYASDHDHVFFSSVLSFGSFLMKELFSNLKLLTIEAKGGPYYFCAGNKVVIISK